MPRFEPKSYTFILNRLTNRVVARSNLTGLESGGQLHTILTGFAREMDDANFQMSNLRDIWSINTATGTDLDERALDFPITEVTRGEATKATGNVTFSRSGTSGTVNIPVGTIVRTANGDAKYETTASGSIADTSSTSGAVTIQALVAGAAGNTDAATITQFDAIAGVETVTNASAVAGGTDKESDETFRAKIRTYLRSLARGTPDALKFAVLGITVDGAGTIRSADVVEDFVNGVATIYVDNGTGTISTTTVVSGGTVVASAVGGESRIFIPNIPVAPGAVFTLYRNAGALTEGTDFTIHKSTGQITFLTSAFPGGLTAADAITADYTYYTGLIQEAQRVVNGDPDDRVNYPGYRCASITAQVLPPTILQQTVIANVTLDSGYASLGDDVRTDVQAAINLYINSLGVNEDVIFSELVAAAQSVPGVYDIRFTTPTANVVIGAGELARALNANIDIT